MEEKLSILKSALLRSWGQDTSSDPERCTKSNPAWGQCAVTSLIVQDYLGGEIVWAEVSLPDGQLVSHYFNEVPQCESLREVDLTRQQFPEGTVVPLRTPKEKGYSSTREYILSFESTRGRYLKLQSRMEGQIGNPISTGLVVALVE